VTQPVASHSPDGSVLTDEELARLGAGLRILALREVGDADVAADVVQETLARTSLAVAAGRLRERAALGAFARETARHVIADVRRRAGRVVPLDTSAAASSVAASDADALDGLIASEDLARVKTVLEELSESDREILRLSYEDGLTPGEIATRLRARSDRIRQRKHRALERLRALFFGGERAPSRSGAESDSHTDIAERPSAERRSTP
jgi:RNA polymerase sigma factor (sigma-70 family)